MVRFAVVFIICFFIQLFIWYLFISKQLQKHHIRKSDIKKLISNLCGGNHNEFNRHCINLSTDENLLLVISVIIIFPIVMTIIIDVAIEAHNWSMLLIFSLSGFCGMNSEFFKKYGVYIELCLNELISYIEIINSGESIHQPKPNIIMIHNTNYQNPTETKAALAQKKDKKTETTQL